VSVVELLCPYLELVEKVMSEARRYRSDGTYSFWDDFINADEKIISVVAARQTGKSTAVIKRAIWQRDRDVIIIAPSSYMAEYMMNLACNVATEMGFGDDAQITRDSYRMREMYVNGHTISIMPIGDFGGYMTSFYENKEIIYEEPEAYNNYLRGMDFINFLTNELNCRVTMVGSRCIRGSSVHREFHQACEQWGFVRRFSIEDVNVPVIYPRDLQFMSDVRFQMEYLCRWGDEIEEQEDLPENQGRRSPRREIFL
jgi:hypothetical protein